MTEKPARADQYNREQVALVCKTSLYLATKLGDYVDEVVIVGGLVPSLLIGQGSLPEGTDGHVGTMDLDIGLRLAILDKKKYQAITERLRSAGFKQDKNERGHPTRQRWKVQEKGAVTVDFLIPPITDEDEGGKIKDIEHDFAAVITPGLRLAFTDRKKIQLDGETVFGEKARRSVWVCGPGAFVILKALAFRTRGENKDAYDLYYLVRNYGNGAQDVAQALKPLLQEREGKTCIEILKEDFMNTENVGPIRVAQFLTGGRDEVTQADVVGFVRELVELCEG